MKKGSNSKYKRRDRSPSPSTSKPKRNRSHSPKYVKNLYDIRHELNRYLEENFNIQKVDDFWSFFLKYEAATLRRNNSFDHKNLLSLRFTKKSSNLFDKLPLYARDGERLNIKEENFNLLLDAVLTYQDFQQKSKFAKLKALRDFQNDLPIARYKDEILEKVKTNKVILIAGDTGCGKSTQVPQYILNAGYKKVACTQPRRLACVSLASRVSHETLTTYKNIIGYQIRFEKSKNQLTNVCFLTEGIILRQTDSDVILSYDVVILDEIHERHLNMDFLIGIMKCLLRRKDFKLILMSATMNLQLFQEYFKDEGLHTIQVPGRLFPIEINYRPIVVHDKKAAAKFNAQPYLNLLEMIDSKYKPNEKGDVLIFLNGFQEITHLRNAIEQYNEIKKSWVVLALHSSLSIEEQDKVFCIPPDGFRKCILSTNIAETSLTIDGIRFVIDSGKVNRMLYDLSSNVNRLYETDISQDSAKQRSGRAGRTGPGICFRLYSEHDLKRFEAFTPAEIHLVPLEALILNMVTLGLNDIEKFPFLEKPNIENLRAAFDRLIFLQAMNMDSSSRLSLTLLGKTMNRLPVDLVISKMLIVSTIFGCVNAVLALASLISVQAPIVESKYYETREHREKFVSNHGEIITLLNLYKEWLEVKRMSSYASRNKMENSRAWARRCGIEEQRFYEVTKLIQQFRDILQDASLIPKLEEGLSSSERVIRNGELKTLRNLRRDLKMSSKEAKRKLLSSNRNDDEQDLRDIEFHITNDYKKLDSLILETKTVSFKDLTLLKLILTSALYPQIAIEDEFNSSKTVNERLYHTKQKNYVFLRPTSYFSENPDFLQLSESDIDVPPSGFFSKLPLSRKHHLLVFQKLLETKKTYIMNPFRMPMLQTLLLFARKVATNHTLTRFAFDDFLVINCPFLWQGKVILMKAVELRKMFQQKLEIQLKSETPATDSPDLHQFIDELINFMQMEVSYNVKRLLPADTKVIYTENNDSTIPKVNPFDPDYLITINSKFGGLNVTENITYDCLVPENYDIETQNLLLSNPLTCDKCNQEIRLLEFMDMLIHEIGCKRLINKETATTSNVIKPNSKTFHCDKCNKDLLLTAVDFLRHKKHCGD